MKFKNNNENMALDEHFIKECISKNTQVSLFLETGIQLKGTITAFDGKSITLKPLEENFRYKNKDTLVYMNRIVSIVDEVVR